MYEESSARTMPVKTAMNSAMGRESTPSRRICVKTCGAQVGTSRMARTVSSSPRPTRATARTGAEAGAERAMSWGTRGSYGLVEAV